MKSMTTIQKENSTKNIEIVKQVYSGINQNKLDTVLNLFDDNVMRIEFEGLPNGGTYKGKAQIEKLFFNSRNTWDKGACEPIDFLCNLNKVVVTVHVKVQLKNDPKWIDAIVTDGFAIKDGLITEFHSFISKQKAFDWAGLSANDRP